MDREPASPNFKKREALIQSIDTGSIIRHGNRTVKYSHTNNPFFPIFIYGTDTDTNALVTIELDDDDLPLVISSTLSSAAPPSTNVQHDQEPPWPPRSAKPPKDDGGLNKALQEIVEATGDPFLGILVKLHTSAGMSSQLIKRFEAKRRREISELLPGEKEYEEIRHTLHVFYQTKNYCEIPKEQRQNALRDMKAMEQIASEEARQAYAQMHYIFGLGASGTEERL